MMSSKAIREGRCPLVNARLGKATDKWCTMKLRAPERCKTSKGSPVMRCTQSRSAPGSGGEGKFPEALPHQASVTRGAQQGTRLGREHKAGRKSLPGGTAPSGGQRLEAGPSHQLAGWGERPGCEDGRGR